MKQKEDCINYDLKVGNLTTMPNIGELFDLWPYLMRYVETVEAWDKRLMKFTYSYPLETSTTETKNSTNSSLFQVFFEEGTQDLNRMVFKASSLDVDVPVMLYARQSITERSFTD